MGINYLIIEKNTLHNTIIIIIIIIVLLEIMVIFNNTCFWLYHYKNDRSLIDLVGYYFISFYSIPFNY